MKYTVSYSVKCNIGRRRKNNQDNFWCDGRYLEEINNGLPETYCGSVESADQPVFSIFDGMGGEQRGEAAAFNAATAFDTMVVGKGEISDVPEFLRSTYKALNAAVCSYGASNGIVNVGTTGATLFFGDKIWACNAGDSRIYKISKGKITRISVDHVLDPSKRKSPLTQFLGVPEDEFIIEPHIDQFKVKNKDRYLICSDGVTDMVSEEDIAKIVSSESDLEKATAKLLETALENGGVDNTTLILCQVKKKCIFSKK